MAVNLPFINFMLITKSYPKDLGKMTLISLCRVSFVVMKDLYKKSNVANYLQ